MCVYHNGLILLQQICMIIHFKWDAAVNLLSYVWLFATPRTVVHQSPLSMEFSRQEYWSGLPFPSSGNLPDPGVEHTYPLSAEFQADSLSLLWRRKWQPVQCSCLENPTDREAWRATVHGVVKGCTRLKDWHTHQSLSLSHRGSISVYILAKKQKESFPHVNG